MNPIDFSIVLALTALVTSLIFFLIGRHHLSKKISDDLERSAVQKILLQWYLRRKWKCIELQNDYPGPFGVSIVVAILESDNERVSLANCPEMTVGTVAELRLRDSGEVPSVCVSLIDQHMLPMYYPKS